MRWLKAVGDTVAENEPLLELETDKVTLELPAPVAGVLHEILKTEQQDVAADDLLARIQIGATQQSQSAALIESKSDNSEVAVIKESASRERNSALRQLSPSVRRLLAEHQLDAAAIQGTGNRSRITAGDVLRHVENTANNSVPVAPRPTVQAEVHGAAGVAVQSRRVPHSPMRKRIAERMVESLLRTAPHVTSVFEADLGAVMAHRAKHRAEFDRMGAPLTLTAYFVAACVAAIRAVPETNSRWSDTELELFETIDIGVAAALEGKGLVVPVLRDVAALNLLGIARQLADLTARAREDRLKPADVRGGTFTISNHGVSGSLVATPIVIQSTAVRHPGCRQTGKAGGRDGA